MGDSELFLLAGTICVFLSSWMIYRLPPRDGRPVSAWTRTEARATATAMLTLILLFLGGVMIAKAIF